ncbi:hypothetical protein [Prauserella cavernicola]|uniref:Integral membrane protein n=1 Tax=Prauserella cavernicola TaxID=2800127 RepID=A0A934QV11_9PSEU|nr:hypothetical protein [Prauserella cavernicola]MBK1786980.1 hypothetical protein [Prauserella cavernicola]
MSGPAESAPLADDERAELERLRAEVEALRTRRPPRRVPWRAIGAAVLGVLGCLLTLVSLLSVWVNNQVSDTDRFVATMSPVIREQSVRAAITDRLTAAVFTHLDVSALTDRAVTALAQRGVPPEAIGPLRGLSGPLESSVHGFVHERIGAVVASPTVAELWDRAIRTGHGQLNAVLSGDNPNVVVSNGEVRLDLAPFVAEVKQQLVAEGFTVADRIPDLHPTITVANARTLERGRTVYSVLDQAAAWLPWVTAVVLAAAVYLARDRRRALVHIGLGIATAMLVLAGALLVVRGIVVGAVPDRSVTAVGDVYDTVVRFLRGGLRTLFAVGVVLALGAFVTGPSVAAVRLRAGTAAAIAWLRGGGARAGLRTGRVGPWVHTYRGVLRTGAVAVAMLVFVFLDRPSGVTVLVIALLLLLCLAVIQFLDQPAAPQRPDG